MSTKKTTKRKPLTAEQKAEAAKKRKEAAAAAKAAKNAKVEIESRHMSELAPKDRNYLEELLRSEPSALTEGEKEHLAARAAYLTTDERKKYGII